MATQQSHNVYTIGNAAYGQQGTGNKDKVINSLQKINKLPDNIQIANIESGWYGSTYIITKNMDLIVFGHNGHCELGLKSYDKCVYFIAEHWYKVRKVPIALIDEIIKYSSPLIDIKKHQRYPLKIPHIRVKYVSSGNLAPRRFIIDQNNDVYGAGDNSFSEIMKPTFEEDLFTTNIEKWSKIKYFDMKNITIKQIACAKTYSIFLDINGYCYTRGACKNGGLGYGKAVNRLQSMTKIKTLKQKIIQIDCGYYHTMAVTQNGNIYSFGTNGYGELGHDNLTGMPTIIPYFQERNIIITKVSCGQHNNVVLDTLNNVYCFGFNGEFQCGIDNHNNDLHHLREPLLNPTLQDIHIVDVKSGSDHLMAKSINNEYYLWGLNDYKQCLVLNNDKYVKVPTLYDREGLDVKEEIVDIYLSDTATRIVTKRV